MTYRIPSGIFFLDTLLTELPSDGATTFFPTFPNARPRVVDHTVDTPVMSTLVNSKSQPKPPHRSGPHGAYTKLGREPNSLPTKEKILCLPLLDVAIHVRVDSAIATTMVVQRFTNVSDITIPEAHYTFPVYDGAAITSLRYFIGDSDVLVGKVLSREEAMEEYLQAIEGMETAALLEEMTPEVFQTMIGNIPPKTSVKVEITYVSQLKMDIGGRGSLITIPTSLAPRYGTPPSRLKENYTTVSTGLAIVVAVNSQEYIRQIECRSHPVSVEMGTAGASPDLHDFTAFYAQASSSHQLPSDSRSLRQATVRLCDPNATMNKDFVVFIKTSEGDSPGPKPRALLSPPDEHGHAALMVTVQPSELFQDHLPQMDFEGEIVFLADRSGSMEGEKISGLRNALQVFLKSLPNSCTFNICSFGSSFHSLWEHSKPYNQENLDEAAAHVAGFSADLGGTELLPALKDVVIRKSRTAPSIQIIALTDGEVWNSNKAVEFVHQSRSRLGASFRLFALGIGNTVSHRVIEGISEAGGGFGEIVGIATPDKWQDRVIRMLKGALMPPSWECQFDLGSEFVRRDLYLDNFVPDHGASDTIVRSYIQAMQSPLLHHFKQSSMFFLLGMGKSVPTVVTIIGNPGGEGERVSVTLPIISTLTSEKALQHLAVKSALINLELMVDQQQPADAADAAVSIASRNAVFLGKTYSVTSRWTSFVATNHDGTVTRSIDSYDAIIGDIDLLTASRPETSSRYGKGGWHLSFGETLASESIVPKPSMYSSTLASYSCDTFPPHSQSADNRTMGRSTFCKGVSACASNNSQLFYNDSSTAQSREYSRGANKNWSNEGAVGYSMDPYGHAIEFDHTPAPDAPSLDDIVKAQKASGRFKLDSVTRESVAANLPAGTREDIEAKMPQRDDEDATEAVDTVMMTKYIETKLEAQKDLLELMVTKANRSVDADIPRPAAGGSAATKDSIAEEDEDEDNNEDDK